MGCVPPEKRQQTAAASIAVKKSNSRNQTENKSKESTTSIQNQNPRDSNHQQLSNSKKNKRKSNSPSLASSPKFKDNYPPVQTMVYDRNSNSDNIVGQQHSIRVLPPGHHKKDTKNDDLSKIASVHSLDLNSKINISEKGSKKVIPAEERRTQEIPQPEQKQEYVNITFNNNTFATANSLRGVHKKSKEDTLRQQLKGMNDQHFRRISIKKMNFDSSRIQ